MAELNLLNTVNCTYFLKEVDDDDDQIDYLIVVMFDCVNKKSTELQYVEAKRFSPVVSLYLFKFNPVQLQHNGLNAEFVD